MLVHHKQSGETYPIAVEFSGKLPTGAALASGTCVAFDAANADVSGTILSGPCTVDATRLAQKIIGGTAGQVYNLRFRATLTTGGSLLDEWVELHVDEENVVTSRIIATAKAINANSYATLDQANAYHLDHLYATSWSETSESRREVALIQATKMIDRLMMFQGQKTTSEQSLRWPRTEAYDLDDLPLDADTIPVVLVEATAELARLLIESDRYKSQDDSSAGIKRVKADTVEVEFTMSDRADLIPNSVTDMLRPIITSSGSDFSVPLVRC